MGFIPLPLGVLATRIVSQAVQITNYGAALILFLAFLCLVSFRILSNIITLGKACDLIDNHQKQRLSTNAAGSGSTSTYNKNISSSEPFKLHVLATTTGSASVSASPRVSRSEKRATTNEDADSKLKTEFYPESAGIFVRSMSIDVSQLTSATVDDIHHSVGVAKFRSVSHSPPRFARRSVVQRRGMRKATPPQIPPLIPELGCQPIFSNSTVSLTSICLNEEIFHEDHFDQTLVGDGQLNKSDN